MNLLPPAIGGRAGPSDPWGLPTITTSHLLLRPFDRDQDLAALTTLTSDPDTMRYLAHGRPWSPDDVDEMLDRHREQYALGLGFAAVIDSETGAFAGWAGVQNPRRWLVRIVDSTLPDDLVEVGWALAPEWRGCGYATEAAWAWLDHGFRTLGLDEIVSVHDPANLASERVMERLGMRRREMLRLDDGDDLCLHAIDADTWMRRP